MRETRTSGSMSGVRRRSDGAERATDEIAKAFGNSYSPSLWQPRLTPTLPDEANVSDEDKVRRIREALRRLLPSEAPDESKLACSFCGKERSESSISSLVQPHI